jgi:hypothetical protein
MRKIFLATIGLIVTFGAMGSALAQSFWQLVLPPTLRRQIHGGRYYDPTYSYTIYYPTIEGFSPADRAACGRRPA